MLFDDFADALLLALVHQLGALFTQLRFAQRLFAIAHSLYIAERLFLDHFELLKHLGVFQVNVSLLSDVFHLLSGSVEVHVHYTDEVLPCKLHLLDRYFVKAGLLDLVELFRHFVVNHTLVNNCRKLIYLWIVLQVFLDVERKVVDLLLNEIVYLSVDLLHFELNFFVFDRANFWLWLWKLLLEILCY